GGGGGGGGGGGAGGGGAGAGRAPAAPPAAGARPAPAARPPAAAEAAARGRGRAAPTPPGPADPALKQSLEQTTRDLPRERNRADALERRLDQVQKSLAGKASAAAEPEGEILRALRERIARLELDKKDLETRMAPPTPRADDGSRESRGGAAFVVHLDSQPGQSQARKLQGRLAALSLDGTALPARIEEVRMGSAVWYRVRSGPFASREQAVRAADLIRRNLQLPGTVVQAEGR
ncbi:MAG: SPOR domain-containing protein, partial [Magnetococcales bacterium]|nr:SPOR domain-containing protein [Magnetococcales bacterium]